MAKGEKGVVLKRLLLILSELEHLESSVLDLSIATGASERTIQRDMKTLELAGLVAKSAGKWQLSTDTWAASLNSFVESKFLAAYLQGLPLGNKPEAKDVFKVIADKPMPLPEKCYKTIFTLRQHILNNDRLRLTYTRNNAIILIFEPYKIVYFDGFWYLAGVSRPFAQPDKAAMLIKLRLDYISDIVPAKPEDSPDMMSVFSPQPQLLASIDTATSSWFGSEQIAVSIMLCDKLADTFRKRKLFHDQELEDSPEGTIARFTVSNFDDFFYKMAHNMPHFRIISPESFAVELKNKISNYFSNPS
jgi:predicted DNA-binding transcriptional regulator YafY